VQPKAGSGAAGTLTISNPSATGAAVDPSSARCALDATSTNYGCLWDAGASPPQFVTMCFTVASAGALGVFELVARVAPAGGSTIQLTPVG
jgi:hypothetical protein